MNGRALRLALFVGTAASPACGAFSSDETTVASASDDGGDAASDAAPWPDANTPDAAPPPPVENDGAALPSCADGKRHFICDGFDGPVFPAPPWVQMTSNATLAREQGTGVSAPYALATRFLPTPSSGGSGSAELSALSAAAARFVRCSFSVFPTEVSPSNNGPAPVMHFAVLPGATSSFVTTDVRIDLASDALVLAFVQQATTSQGQLANRKVSQPVPTSTWTKLGLSLDLTSKVIELSVAGQAKATDILPLAMDGSSGVKVHVGLGTTRVASAWRIDDVVCDTTE